MHNDSRSAIEGVPGFPQTVIAVKPDLVTGISIYEFGPVDGTPTLKQLAEVGAEVLVACDVTGGGASTGVDATCRYIEQLAALFDVGHRGAALITELKAQNRTATGPYAGSAAVRTLTLSSAPEGGKGVDTSGGSNLANGIVTLAGGANHRRRGQVGLCQPQRRGGGRRDPSAIVVITGFGADSCDALVEVARIVAVLHRPPQ